MQRVNGGSFSKWLRTGQVVLGGVEIKFNPYHDPANGRITTAAVGGGWMGGGFDGGGGGSFGGGGATGSWGETESLRSARNHFPSERTSGEAPW